MGRERERGRGKEVDFWERLVERVAFGKQKEK